MEQPSTSFGIMKHTAHQPVFYALLLDYSSEAASATVDRIAS